MATKSKLEVLFQDFADDQVGNRVSRFALASLQASVKSIMAEEKQLAEQAMKQQFSVLEDLLKKEQEENARLGGIINGDNSK